LPHQAALLQYRDIQLHAICSSVIASAAKQSIEFWIAASGVALLAMTMMQHQAALSFF
jgi:hypothetical protein